MNIVDDPRKHELFRILKNLYFIIDKEKFDRYMYLKGIYNNLLKSIFGSDFKKGDEAWEWDNVRNALDTLVFMKNALNEVRYEKEKKGQLIVALKRIEALKGYLT